MHDIFAHGHSCSTIDYSLIFQVKNQRDAVHIPNNQNDLSVNSSLQMGMHHLPFHDDADGFTQWLEFLLSIVGHTAPTIPTKFPNEPDRLGMEDTSKLLRKPLKP